MTRKNKPTVKEIERSLSGRLNGTEEIDQQMQEYSKSFQEVIDISPDSDVAELLTKIKNAYEQYVRKLNSYPT